MTTFAEFGCGPCLFSCQDISRIWNASVVRNLGTVHIVESISSGILASTLPSTTWNSRSCGVVRLCGAQCGRGPLRTVLYHMRRTHHVPLSVKAENLARFFPPWTVTREQWAAMNMPSISGVAIDTLLYSRIGSPLCHRYRIISRTRSQAAFRGYGRSRSVVLWRRYLSTGIDGSVASSVCGAGRRPRQGHPP